MFLIIYTLIFQILLGSYLKQLNFDMELVGIIFVLLHATIVIIYLKKMHRNEFIILFIAFIIRLIALFWDIYAKDIFPLVGSGGDSEGFFHSAKLISTDLTILKGYIYGGLYSKFLGIISYLFGTSRVLLQYINVLLGIFIIIIVKKTLQICNVSENLINRAMIVLALLPISIIHSAILLRENLISFLVVLSIYNFTKWYSNQKLRHVLGAISSILIASVIHSGAIAMLSGYVLSFIFYSSESKNFKFSMRSILYSAIGLIMFYSLFSLFSDVLLYKFSEVKEVSDLAYTAVSGRGGSQYLTNIKINSVYMFVIFIPIKIFYFLGSPLPFYWRGLFDILSFLIDGIIYLYLITKIVGGIYKKRCNSAYLRSLNISLFSTLCVFSIGLNNAGTAMRHRNKFFPVIIIIFTLLNRKEVYSHEEISK